MAKTTTPTYGDKDIKHLSDADWVLLRPENHIRTTDQDGQLHIIKEIFDNALDETEISEGGELEILLFLDRRNKTYQVIISDNGRGVPLGKLEDSFTKLKTSGKYDKNAYQTSGGLNGIGGKVAMILSENFKVITLRDNKVGHLVFHRAETLCSTITDYPSKHTGTVVAMEPRHGFFTGVDIFVESHYDHLVKLSLILGMFSQNTRIVCRAVYEGISPEFWTMNAVNALDYLNTVVENKAVVLADGADNEAVMHHLREMWQVDSQFIWNLLQVSSASVPHLEHQEQEVNDPLRGVREQRDVELSFKFNLYLPKIFRGTFVTSVVNNIPMKDMTSSHITGLVTALKFRLASRIEDDEIRKFFIDLYRMPICAAISIKYGDVRYTGLAKDGFKSSVFEKRYVEMLRIVFQEYSDDVWAELYNHLAMDVVTRYHEYYNKPMSKSASRKNSMTLDKHFYECNTPDRSKAELFIVEGVSADHIRLARTPDGTQAVFMIKGVPSNVSKSSTGKRTPIERINSYPAYKQLSEIIGIRPGQTDLSTARYGKIICTNDADIDGGHICALHIGALYHLNPRIIESGMVYIANPPLYEILLEGKDARKIFVRTKSEFVDFRCSCLYQPTLDIYVDDVDHRVFGTPQKLTGDEYIDFCKIVVLVGEIYTELEKKLGIDAGIIEKLTYLTKYIQPGRVDGNTLRAAFGSKTIYDPTLNILTVAGRGDERDSSFSLDGVAEAMYEELLPVLYNLQWKKLEIRVTTKLTDSLNMVKVTMFQLYKIFETLNGRLKVDRNKGLGGMTEKDLELTCMDPATRHLHQITSLGDAEKILDLLGDDSSTRKRILEDLGLLES